MDAKRKTFKEGDRVILAEKDKYGDSPCNPIWGGQYSCVGTIIPCESCGEVHDGIDAGIMVKWDNGERNGYEIGDLDFVEPEKPAHKPFAEMTMKELEEFHKENGGYR